MQKHILIIIFISSYLLSINAFAQSLYMEAGSSLYITGNAVIDGAVSNSPTMFSDGSIQNNGSLINQGEIQLQGDFSNTGTFNSTGDEVFVGTGTQSLSGNLTNTNALYNVVIDKTGNPLSLGNHADVNHQVNFVNGKINVGTNNLSLVPAATFSGQSANNYVQTTSTGTLRQHVGTSDVIFPVGNSSYNPVTLKNTGTNDVFSARVADAAGCSGGNLGISNKVNRTWHLSEDVAGGSNASITTQWAAGDEDTTFVRNKSGIAIDNGTTFNLPAANTTANVVSAGVFSQTQTGQTLISPRVITSMDSVTVTGSTIFCGGGDVTLQAAINAAYTYQWYKNNVAISGAINSSYIASVSGQYSAYISVNGTCILKTAPISVNIEPPVATPTLAFSSPANNGNTLTLCTGATAVTMSCTASNVAEYIWYKNGVIVNSGVAPNNSYTVNTNISGTDVYQLAVVYTGTTCLSPLSNPLTLVKTQPTATITPIGPTTFCPNNPTVLQASTGANYTYTWKRGATIVQVGGTSYTPTTSGNHNLTVTDGNTGCVKISPNVGITVKALPTANAGADKSVCAGLSVPIGSSSVAGNTYTWSPVTGLNSGVVSNPTVMPSNSTTYTVTVTNTATGCSKTDAVLVTKLAPPPTPSLTATASPVCQGTNVSVLPSVTTGAASIDWYKNGVFLYNKPVTYTEVVSVASASANNYIIKSKGSNTCTSNFSNAQFAWVKEAAIPTISAVPAAVGNVVKVCVPGGTSGNATLTATSTTAAPTYSWRLAGNFIAAANTNTYTANVTTAANNKVFSVQATYPNGCVRTSTNVTVQLVTTGCVPAKEEEGKTGDMLISLDEISMSAFPNPTQGELNVQIANVKEAEGTIFLYNALGQVVKEQTLFFSEGKTEVLLDVKDIAVGIYTLSFQSGDAQKTLKVVKE